MRAKDFYVNQRLKRNYCLFILLFVSIFATAQSVKLNPEVDIDTLSIWMNYSDEIEPEFQTRLHESVLKAITKFNAEQSGFTVLLDSMKTKTSMTMNMAAIDYVDRKDNTVLVVTKNENPIAYDIVKISEEEIGLVHQKFEGVITYVRTKPER